MKSLIIDTMAPGRLFDTAVSVKEESVDGRAHSAIVGPDERSWPDSYRYLGNYPTGEQEESWSEHLQGVTHDDRYWYVTGTQPNRIMRIDATQGFTSLDLIGYVDLPSGYDHVGALDHRDGLLYVPPERGERAAAIGVFGASSLRFVTHAEVPEQGHTAAWCAFSPVNGLLYSSGAWAQEVLGYEATYGSGRLTLTLRDRVPLLLPMEITGGCISARGHLYLAVNAIQYDEYTVDSDDIWFFDMLDGRPVTTLDYGRGGVGQYPEGVTLWDLDARPDIPGPGGQLHFLLINRQYVLTDASGRDSFWFKHWRARPATHV